MPDPYDPSTVEPKWQKIFEEKKLFETDLSDSKDKFYSFSMFPYPSGDRLHIGHWYNFAPADSIARYYRMHGKNVCTPMGFDAFGLPAENYAIKKGVHPSVSIAENVERMIAQLKRMGCMFDWSKTVNTSTPEYFQWTQWLFLQMFKNGLAYKKEATVNFCTKCKTVLANEQVWDGKCERCDSEVLQKPLEQWFWKITDYAQKLLDNLEDLDWPEKTKTMQRNWIGRSEGCDVSWKVDGSDIVLDTYTTTVDTIYGVTFLVISPEHPDLESLISDDQKRAVEKYCKKATKKSELDRIATDKDKTGVDTGYSIIHPFTGKKVPLWVADYVLMSYGTGVVMGVPAHDQRDMDFAKKYELEIIQSIQDSAGESFVYDDVDKYRVEGTLVDSGDFTGMPILEARSKIVEELGKSSQARPKVQYRIRDWLISRQRYWGAPIPIVYDPDGNPHPIPEEHLPWELPTDVEFKPKGTAPLAQSKELKRRTEKIFGEGWTPEVDTMDTFVCSSFYQFRYLAEGSSDQFISKEIEKNWMPVDLYVGGPEHACMHLIYARFVTMALKDFGHIAHEEPFQKLVHQGLVTNKGAKMSKSKGNVVSPDEFVERYGSDTFRMYLMFMGPFTDGAEWSDTGIKGIDRFVQKVWRVMQTKVIKNVEHSQALDKKINQTIKKVTEDIEILHFNTAIAALMELFSEIEKGEGIDEESAQKITLLLAPMAPHLAEEIWQQLGLEGYAIDQTWPTYDETKLVSDTVTVAVQVNGKLRGSLEVASDLSQEDLLTLAKEHPNVAKHIEGKEVKKQIVVPGKLVSLVV